jgi:hypothetical protein
MPQVDIRVALTNPYTADRFDVIRRADTTNNYGEQILNPTVFSNRYGIVHPASGYNDLQRMTDAQLQGKAIVVITRFALRGASQEAGEGASFQPDIVVWNNDNYLVQIVDDYSQFASGFMYCICTLLDINQVPAITQQVNIPTVLPTPAPPPAPSGPQIVHYPLEQPDGVRTSFTFVGLPSDPSQYQILWNGLRQMGFTQSGNTINLGPPGTPAPAADDDFYGVW